MSIAGLKVILPPPVKPLETGDIDSWNDVEAQLRTKLPKDYKDFIRIYGTGTINDFLFILNPFSINQYVNLLKRSRVAREALQTSKTQFPRYYVDNVYPDEGGLLPFGVTDNGEVLYWKTGGEPEEWKVTVYESRGPKHFEFDAGMTEFLGLMLTRIIECDVLPRNFVEGTPTFKPVEVPAL